MRIEPMVRAFNVFHGPFTPSSEAFAKAERCRKRPDASLLPAKMQLLEILHPTSQTPEAKVFTQ